MVTTRTQYLAAAVRDARQAQGITQAELAKLVGVHAQTIGNLERAQHEPSPDLVAKVTQVLRLDMSNESLAAQQSVALIERSMIDRLQAMTEAERLIFVGEVMRYVVQWSPEGGNGEGD